MKGPIIYVGQLLDPNDVEYSVMVGAATDLFSLAACQMEPAVMLSLGNNAKGTMEWVPPLDCEPSESERSGWHLMDDQGCSWCVIECTNLDRRVYERRRKERS